MIFRKNDGDDFQVARARMVAGQVAARGVQDARVLTALRKVPRHVFVAPDRAAEAYRDQPVPVVYRFESAPMRQK